MLKVPTVALPSAERGAYSPTAAFERSLARQDELLRRSIETQDARVQKALDYARGRFGTGLLTPSVWEHVDRRGDVAVRVRSGQPSLLTRVCERFEQYAVWLEPYARRVEAFEHDGRPIIHLTWEDVRGRPWLIATLRNCGWKVLEGRIFNDDLLFGVTEPLPVAVAVAEIRKARGDPPGDAGSVEPAETDRQQQAGVCERRERKGEPPLCWRTSSRSSTRSWRLSARSRSRSAALTCSCVGASRCVAHGGSCSTTRPIRLRRSSLLPNPLATR